MELIKYFIHEHPLIIINSEARNDDDEAKLVCRMCVVPILGTAATYGCSRGGCDFPLHKRCAELPQKIITHPLHECEHPLTLSSIPWNQGRKCNSCHVDHDFNYTCKSCEFKVCVSCSHDEERVVRHPGHNHPLTLLNSSATLHCSACDTKAEDFSYLCTICRFWIHKSCFLLPRSRTISDHRHALSLVFSLPDQYRNFQHICDLCGDRMFPSYWLYCCGRCRYFAHIKCVVTSEKNPSMSRDVEIENIDEHYLDPNLVYYPLREESTDLISQFLQAISIENGTTPLHLTRIIHHSHSHPLMLIDSSRISDMKLRCDGCGKPISSDQCYGCRACNFYLHSICAFLRPISKHPCHSKDPQFSYMAHHYSRYFICSVCKVFCNGFAFTFFGSQEQRVCVGCGSAPITVKHEAHNHFLRLEFSSREGTCNACREDLPNFKYKCTKCQYQVHNYCVALAGEIKHLWDHHPFKLIYPPFEEIPDDIICEFCEEDIHPKFWMYHCRKCNQSFHLKCINPGDRYSNIRSGGTIRVKNHDDPLKFVLKGERKSPFKCNGCGKLQDDYPGLKCEPCNFVLCLDCGESNVAEVVQQPS